MIDHEKIKSQIKIDTFTKMIQKNLETEVFNEIKEQIMPNIEKQIKTFAKEAVKKWVIEMQTVKSHNGFDTITMAQIKFTENVFNKVYNGIEPEIEIIKDK